MKIADTISVNPSKTTLGQVESTSTVFRAPVLGSQNTSAPADLLKVIFPSCSAGLFEYKKYALPLRTIFATILIVTGITLLQSGVSAGVAICSLCFGAFLALGLLTRPVMLGAAVFYCISGALSIRYSHIDMNVFSLMFGSVLFAVIGAGKYSCDTLLRRVVMHNRKKSEIKRKENFMGYKAFHNVNY